MRNNAQRAAIQGVFDAHRRRPGPPVAQRGEAALQQLLRRGTTYECTPGQLANYDPAKVSLPTGQQEATPLCSLLEGEDLRTLDNFEEKMKLSDEEAAGFREDTSLPPGFMDPVLARDRSKYVLFIESLVGAGVLGFTLKPRMRVGAFFIIDARPVNCFFRRPPRTVLGSMESWTRLEVERGESLHVA